MGCPQPCRCVELNLASHWSRSDSAWQTCPLVKDAVALLIDGELWGFVTPDDVDVNAVTEATKKSQPYYAVPTRWYALDELPHTA